LALDPNDPYSRLPPSDNIEDRRGPLTDWRDEMLPAHFDQSVSCRGRRREGGAASSAPIPQKKRLT
jgi:hypothetical protein